MLKTIYVACDTSFVNEDSYYENLLNAENTSIHLASMGWAPYIAIKNFSNIYKYEKVFPAIDLTIHLCNISLLVKCDALLLLSGSENCEKCEELLSVCRDHNIPIFYQKEGLPSPDEVES